MKTEQDFRRIRAVKTAALLISLLMLLFICAAPQLIIRRASEEISPLLSSAQGFVLADMTEKALPQIERIDEIFKERRGVLMLFFDHSLLWGLEESIRTSRLLAQVGDVEQLLSELAGIETELEYLLRLNEARMRNLL